MLPGAAEFCVTFLDDRISRGHRTYDEGPDNIEIRIRPYLEAYSISRFCWGMVEREKERAEVIRRETDINCSGQNKPLKNEHGDSQHKQENSELERRMQQDPRRVICNAAYLTS